MIAALSQRLAAVLDGIQTEHPTLASMSHWVNLGFTVFGFTITSDTLLKVLAFLFVTLPLGVVQWWNLVDRWKARKAKKNASR